MSYILLDVYLWSFCICSYQSVWFSLHAFLFLFYSYDQEVYNYKIAARPERRRQFEKELTSQIETALNILTACLNINELKEQVGTFPSS